MPIFKNRWSLVSILTLLAATTGYTQGNSPGNIVGQLSKLNFIDVSLTQLLDDLLVLCGEQSKTSPSG